MIDDPKPYPGDLLRPLPGLVHLERAYRDLLGRPLSGTVTITGRARHASDGQVIPPLPVPVQLTDGLLSVDLPPDTYTLSASLSTVEGARKLEVDTVTLSA